MQGGLPPPPVGQGGLPPPPVGHVGWKRPGRLRFEAAIKG